MPAVCFNPHHAIKATNKDGATRTFVMCFECGEAKEFTNPPGDGAFRSYVISPLYESAFDAIIGATDPSFKDRTRFTGIAATHDISSGEEITSNNSWPLEKWKDELFGKEIKSIDYSRHPRATRRISDGWLIRSNDFTYSN